MAHIQNKKLKEKYTYDNAYVYIHTRLTQTQLSGKDNAEYHCCEALLGAVSAVGSNKQYYVTKAKYKL